MQRNCIFPGRYAPLTYYEDVLEASRNTLMIRCVCVHCTNPAELGLCRSANSDLTVLSHQTSTLATRSGCQACRAEVRMPLSELWYLFPDQSGCDSRDNIYYLW